MVPHHFGVSYFVVQAAGLRFEEKYVFVFSSSQDDFPETAST